jgi:hypothetical protein
MPLVEAQLQKRREEKRREEKGWKCQARI